MNTSNFFDECFEKAEVNSILLLNTEGIILNVNTSFCRHFGYTTQEISGKNFEVLFTPEDREMHKPRLELAQVKNTGQSGDENYVVNKAGHPIWCAGESLLVTDNGGNNFVAKIIINLQAKKQMQRFVRETEALLERVFESTDDIPIMILDGSLKILKTNPAFISLFKLNERPVAGCSLTDLKHPLWSSEAVRKALRSAVVHDESLFNYPVEYELPTGVIHSIKIDCKIVTSKIAGGKEIYVLVEDVPTKK